MSISCRRLAAWWGALALALAIPTGAQAQTESGKVVGTVTDQSGAVLPGVAVNLKSVSRASTRSTVTDSKGIYVFAGLVPGPYELTAELSGFSTKQVKTTVTVGATVAVDLQMAVGTQTEVVTVLGETSTTINTTTQDIATVVNEAQIRELPTITRNPYDLVQLSGQAIRDEQQSERGAGFSINGARSASTNVLMDGVANNDEFSATVGQAVPLDSVQEFSVITSNFSPQYGRASGGVVNVATKSGTNAFRGNLYDFFRSDGLSTNTYDNKANGIEQGDFSRHQAGFTVGGPLKKDKAHFFLAGEYIRVRGTDTEITWVPTPELIAASAPATRAFFAAYGKTSINGPILTRGDVSSILGSAAGAFNSLPASLPAFGQVRKSLPTDAGGGNPQNNYQLVGRMDLSLSPNTQAYIRYAYQNQKTEPGTNASSPYEGYDTGTNNFNHNVLASVTHVFSASLTSQTKVSWNRLNNDQPLNGDPQPTLYMNPTSVVRLQGYRIGFPGYLPFNPGSAIPFGGPQSQLVFYQDMNWVKGKHDLRFGGSYTHMNDDRTFGAYENAVEALNLTSAAIPSLDNLVLGQIRRFQVAINPKGYPGGTFVTPVEAPSFLSKNRYNEYAVYAGDTWSLSSRLKLNIGLRYEYYGPQTKTDPKNDSNFYYGDPSVSVTNSSITQIIDGIRTGTVSPSNESPVGGLWKADKNNFAPRVGFAWDVNGDGKTSLRGGYGMAFERNFGNVTYNVLFNPPQYLVSTIDAPSDVPSQPIYTNNTGPFGGIPGIRKNIPAGSLRHVDQNIETAFSHFYSASLHREIAANTTASIEYTGSTGRKLYDLADPNKRGAPLVYEGVGTPTSRPNTRYAAFNTRGNRGRSQYHGVTVGIDTRHLGNTGLAFTTKYTLSHAKDNLSSTFSDSAFAFNLGYLDAFDPMLDYGSAEFDVRHKLLFAGTWELPIARNSTGATRTILGGWALNWILTARSGYPFTIYDCTNGLGLCMRAIEDATLSHDATSGPSTGNSNEFKLLDLTPIMGAAGSYVNPVTGNSDFGPYPGNMSARGAFYGPGAWNVDMSLNKRFRFGDHYALQLRFEAYNVFNHANMYVVGGNADVSSFSEITGFKGYTQSGGRVGDGQRRLQIGAKFEF